MVDNLLRLKPGDDLRMMKTPDAWPLGPVLCLANRNRQRDDDLGVLVLHPDVERTEIFLLNVYDPRMRQLLAGNTTGLKSVRYDSFEAILADGWLVN